MTYTFHPNGLGTAGPYSKPSVRFVPADAFQSTLDSRQPNTTGSVNHQDFRIGVFTYTFTTQMNQTICNLTPFTDSRTRSFVQVRCAPVFEIDPWGNVIHFGPGPNPGTPVTNYVYVPPSLQGGPLDTAVTNASTSLNTTLTNYNVPVRFQRTTTPCTSGDGHCVELQVATPDNPIWCAQIGTPTQSSSGGVITNTSIMKIRPDWNNPTTPWAQSFLNRTVAHELTHGLGLKENACQAVDSVMGTFSSCGVAMSTTSATATDAMPVQKTTYGNPANRNSCF